MLRKRNPDGTPFAAVSVTAAGGFEAVDADLGQLGGLITLQDRTYTAQRWTIPASGTGVEVTKKAQWSRHERGDDGVRSF
jgi:hypothetical protein